jgi:hypothetical protein
MNKKLIINYFKLELYILLILCPYLSVILYIPIQEYIEKYTDDYSIYISVIFAIIIPNIIFTLFTVVYLKIRKYYIFNSIYLKIFIYNFFILLIVIIFGFMFLLVATFSTDNPNQTKEGALLIFLIPNIIIFIITIFMLTRPFVNHLDKSIKKIKENEK